MHQVSINSITIYNILKRQTYMAIKVDSDVHKEAGYGNIFMSNVVVMGKRNLFLGRKWRTLDIKMLIWFMFVHLLVLFAPFTFTWRAFWTGISGYVVGTMFGMSLCLHRCLSHRSFKLPKWLEYIFAYIAVQTGQRDPIYWASIHRYHHQFTDTLKDAHSPTSGLAFSHIGWLFDSAYIMEKYQERNNVDDLKSQAYYRFLKTTYVWHVLGFTALTYILGGFRYLVWATGVRLFLNYHATFLVNSVCHVWGTQAWKSKDNSKNNWVVAVLCFGEGWHNNHHTFQFSARVGLEWWQLDPTWWAIRFLQVLGLATHVKVPSEAQKLKKSSDPVN